MSCAPGTKSAIYDGLVAIASNVLNNWRCSEDQHSDCQSERRRHVCVVVRDLDGRCRGRRDSYVAHRGLGPVRLSRLADADAALGFSGCVNLRNYSHRVRTLRRCRLSHLVPGKKL